VLPLGPSDDGKPLLAQSRGRLAFLVSLERLAQAGD
jgi:hypothetical protein